MSFFTGFRVPQHCAAGGNCLRRFGDLRKNTPWIFGACILWILSTFVDFRVHQVVNSSTTLHLYAYLYVLAPPWSYSISEIRNPAYCCCCLSLNILISIQISQQTLDFQQIRDFSRSAFLDMRKTFPGTLQDFSFEILKSRYF